MAITSIKTTTISASSSQIVAVPTTAATLPSPPIHDRCLHCVTSVATAYAVTVEITTNIDINSDRFDSMFSAHLRCDSNSDAEPQLSTELRVQGLPTLVFFRAGSSSASDGLSEVHRVEGVPGNADALRALVQEHLGVS